MLNRAVRSVGAHLGVVVCAFALVLGAAPAASAVEARPGSRVIVVLAPYLTWNDVTAGTTPNLLELASSGAMGNMNAQTADQDVPASVRGALTLGAGRWVGSPYGAPSAYDVDEPYESGTAADAYVRYFGYAVPPQGPNPLAKVHGTSIVYLGLPSAAIDSSTLLARPELGALGEAVTRAGRLTAAVGCSDEDTSSPSGALRSAALVAMEASGTVSWGTVAADPLLTADPTAPFGKRTDYDKLEEAIHEAWPRGRGGLLVIDTGDLVRARDAASQRSPAAEARDRRAALAGLDRVVGLVREGVGGSADRIVVVSNAVEQPYWNQPLLAPIVVYGGGFTQRGDGQAMLTSPSTHRDGLVTNLDVAPTVLGELGIDAPASMLGSRMRVRAGASTDFTAAKRRLTAVNDFALAVDSVRDRIVTWWLVGTLVAFAFGAFVVWRRRASTAVLSRAAILLALAVPPATWLIVMPTRYVTSSADVIVTTIAWTVALWALALLLLRVRTVVQLPLLLLLGLTSGLVVVDNLAHRPWAESGMFSYSVLAGWRYYGVGNEGSALAVAASVLLVGLATDAAAGTKAERWLRLLGMPLVGALTLLALAAPGFGANAGVAIWGVVAFGLGWLFLAQVRLSWKAVGWGLAAVIAGVVLVGVLDLARGVAAETHFGKLLRAIGEGEWGLFGELIARKAVNAWNYSTQTTYTWLAASAVATLAFLRLDRRDDLDDVLARNTGFAAAFAGLLAGAAVALVSEDSGTAMPALMLAEGVGCAIFLALAGLRPLARGAETPTPSATMDADEQGGS
ncbi:MAG: hypothetical protein HY876_10920 [Coriobacteriales bacterium]|nr:hypothetical protein [Coriobacteriales bacterium]